MTYSGVGTAENARLTPKAAATTQNAVEWRRWCRGRRAPGPGRKPGSAAARSVCAVMSAHLSFALAGLAALGLPSRMDAVIYHVQRKIFIRLMSEMN